MATFSRVTTLLIMAVFITYYCGTEAQMVSKWNPVTKEWMKFDSAEDFEKWIELGINMYKKTYDSICWYEQLKEYPFNSRRGYFRDCYDPIVDRASPTRYNTCMKVFPRALNITGRLRIPGYHSKCRDLLLTPRAIPKENEGSVLNDGEDEYAYKAYFHCLIHQVREILGDKVIQIIKTERIDSKRDRNDWMKTVTDRVNEFRSRHGVGALQLNKTLTNDAQKRADTMAENCTIESGENSTHLLIAESVSRIYSYPDFAVPVCEWVNHWYKEGMDYPFPKGVDELARERKSQYKNFANLVWKGAKSVGYGYKFSGKCPGFLVVHFHPVEKKDGEYTKNVLPPSP